MSRTDKTRPYWVKCNDPKVPTYHIHRHQEWRSTPRECDDTGPYTSAKDYHARYCGRYIEHWVSSPWGDYPSKAFRRVGYWQPERAATRMSTREAMRTYNSGGDVDDVDILTNQHRHATYSGGYWD
jgi:hypothetical protein